MCDRYSYEFGYICDECYRELVNKCRSIGSVSHNIVEEFMDSEKAGCDSLRWINETLDEMFIYR